MTFLGLRVHRGPHPNRRIERRGFDRGGWRAWFGSLDPKGESFRPDIQGLRAVAVLLVALNHAGVPHMGGGFVGVDVFFVISGFLITGWLLHRSERESRVPFADFYAARARRILPAASLTLVAVIVASYHWLNYVRAVQVFHDAIWAAFFAANVHFAQIGTDYFARNNPPSPLQHFWTLAVEEQFYVVWPALFGLALVGARWGGGRRVRRVDRAAKRRLAILLVICIGGSLVYSVRETTANPVGAYFSTLARAWELGIGALIAVAATQLTRVPASLRTPVGWVGVGGIVLAAASFSAGTPFPGYAALLPVLGAAFVLISGLGGTSPRLGVGRLLGRQPLRLIGDVSFGFYLWHWPFLVIPAEYLGHPLSVSTNLLLLCGAFVLSLATFWFYENPLRYGDFLEGARSALALWPVTVTAVGLAAEITIGLVYYRLPPPAAPFVIPEAKANTVVAKTTAAHPKSNSHTTSSAATDPYVAEVAASVTSNRLRQSVSSNLYPPFLSLSVYSLGSCAAANNETSSPICRMGDTSSQRTMVVFGDSHVQMWMPAILSFATRHHWAVVPLVHVGCVAAIWSGETSGDASCLKWFQWATAQARQLRPAAVIIGTAYSGQDLNGGTNLKETEDGVGRALAALGKASHKLVVIQDPPYPQRSPVDCLLATNATLGSCTFSLLSRFNQQIDSGVALDAEIYHAKFIPVLEWFCADSKCPMVIGRAIAYGDSQHVSATYAQFLARPLGESLQQALRE